MRNEIALFVSTSVAINITEMIAPQFSGAFWRFYRKVLIAIIARKRFSGDKLLALRIRARALRADSVTEVSALN